MVEQHSLEVPSQLHHSRKVLYSSKTKAREEDSHSHRTERGRLLHDGSGRHWRLGRSQAGHGPKIFKCLDPEIELLDRDHAVRAVHHLQHPAIHFVLNDNRTQLGYLHIHWVHEIRRISHFPINHSLAKLCHGHYGWHHFWFRTARQEHVKNHKETDTRRC